MFLDTESSSLKAVGHSIALAAGELLGPAGRGPHGKDRIVDTPVWLVFVEQPSLEAEPLWAEPAAVAATA
jgi:hypothetical protein